MIFDEFDHPTTDPWGIIMPSNILLCRPRVVLSVP